MHSLIMKYHFIYWFSEKNISRVIAIYLFTFFQSSPFVIHVHVYTSDTHWWLFPLQLKCQRNIPFLSLATVYVCVLKCKIVFYRISCERLGYGRHFAVEVGASSQQVPYDYSSVMHFRHNAFSREIRHKSTVLPRNQAIPKSELGSSYTGTNLDFLHINLLYCGGMAAKYSLFLTGHFVSLQIAGSYYNMYISALYVNELFLSQILPDMHVQTVRVYLYIHSNDTCRNSFQSYLCHTAVARKK